jgi:hypothetical protein
MSRFRVLLALFAFGILSLTNRASGQEDLGKAVLGRVSVTVIYATNADSKVAEKKAGMVSKDTEKRLRSEVRLRFNHYVELGHDVQPLLRSYESWAQPMKPSNEILVKFEALSLPTDRLMKLDLELWLGGKKILKTDARLEGKKPLYVLGPGWRGGRLIIAVALAPKEKPHS